MTNFYFSKPLTILYFIFWSTIFAINLGFAIGMTITGHTQIGLWVIALVLPLGPIGSLKYLIAAYKNTPALTITNEYIHTFQSNDTFLWSEVKDYQFRVNLFLSILEMHIDRTHLHSAKSPLTRFLWRTRYLLSNKVLTSLTILQGNAKAIFNAIDEYALRSKSVNISEIE